MVKIDYNDKTLEGLTLVKTDDFSIRHVGKVHDGKVRSVYWLTRRDSKRLIEQRGYDVYPDSRLGVMVISDRISAFNDNWLGEKGLGGVPAKGTYLNTQSMECFELCDQIAPHHVLDIPHPLVWIVQKAEPVIKIEAIARQYITGGMLRDYEKGERVFCGIRLSEGLKKNERLDKLLITPTTKGKLRGYKGISTADDANITRKDILRNWKRLGFRYRKDVQEYEEILRKGFELISVKLDAVGEIFVDTKFEFGYLVDADGDIWLGVIDEVGTGDSSRIWDKKAYEEEGKTVEKSKEGFRQFLMNLSSEEAMRWVTAGKPQLTFSEHSTLKNYFVTHKDCKELMTNPNKIPGIDHLRKAFARVYRVPEKIMREVSETYKSLTKRIIGKEIIVSENPRQEIIDSLTGYGILIK